MTSSATPRSFSLSTQPSRSLRVMASFQRETTMPKRSLGSRSAKAMKLGIAGCSIPYARCSMPFIQHLASRIQHLDSLLLHAHEEFGVGLGFTQAGGEQFHGVGRVHFVEHPP